jgi:rhodanese-related sulfurtransferase
VRTPDEFSSDHIENAKNINWLGSTFISDVEKWTNQCPFCILQSAEEAKKQLKKLNELGFTTIYQLEGGILKWEAGSF